MALTLDDREAIRDLFARQNLAYDRREAERTAAMFTEDGALELHGEDFDLRFEGRDAIEREADAADSSLADVMRDAIERGLPLVRDARRKRQRSRART